MDDDINARPQVILTGVVSDQCARWDCIRKSLTRGDYCTPSCLEMAISYSKATRPFGLANVFSSTTQFAPLATQILKLLKANKESGVPRLSQDVFTVPPWQSSMFALRYEDARERFYEWLFIGLCQIPETSDFEWTPSGGSKMIGEVKHCVFKPLPREDDKWKLHQYSILEDMTGKAVYVMHYNKEGRAIKPVTKRKQPQKDKHINQVPVSGSNSKVKRLKSDS